jgi:heme oxygenase
MAQEIGVMRVHKEHLKGDLNEGRHPGSRREALRLATDELHRSLDKIVSSYDLRRIDHYAAFLGASAAPLLALEHMLESAGVEQVVTDWAAHRRSAVIVQDLKLLGLTASPLQLRRALPTRSEMYGILYVLEGSRLGARGLHAHVQTSSDEQVRAASGYLRAHNPSLWRNYLKLLESSVDVTELHDLVSGALFAFALFQRSFDRLMPADVRPRPS